MSATTATWRHAPAPTSTHAAHTARAPESQTANDHGLLVKVTAGVLLVAAAAATIAPLGWAALAAAVIVLLATTAAVLRTTLRLLNEDDRTRLLRAGQLRSSTAAVTPGAATKHTMPVGLGTANDRG